MGTVFSVLFVLSGLLAVLGSWFRLLDPWAFGFLTVVAALRGFYGFAEPGELRLRIIVGLLFLGISTGQLIVARWPAIYDAQLLKFLVQQRGKIRARSEDE